MTTPFDGDPILRYRIYVAFWIMGMLFGSIQVAYSAAGDGEPTWLKVALAVYTFLGSGVNYTAAANTERKP
jgi:hypothetical protein